jgi:glycosyltransferase involved in cell wall biosynthesis
MRVLHVVRDLDAASGGPSQSVPSLSIALAQSGVNSQVVYEDFGNSIAGLVREEIDSSQHDSRELPFVPIQRQSRFWNPHNLGAALEAKFGGARWDLIHVHGLWTGLGHCGVSHARKHNIPYVISPRGMLSPWCLSQKRLKKRLGYLAYQKRDLMLASLIHTTAAHETEHVRSLKLENPIACLPNGCFMNELQPRSNVGQRLRKKQITFISRIHPVKGLPLLVEAWAEAKLPGWKCVIAGPDSDDHLSTITRLAESKGVADEIEFLPEVKGEQKASLLSESSAIVLPSQSENFGMIVVEALAAGTPVIATRGTPWKDLESSNCGWWINRDVPSLVHAITKVSSLQPHLLNDMGQRGIKLVQDKYCWQAIAEQMRDSYQWILGGGERPNCCRTHESNEQTFSNN